MTGWRDGSANGSKPDLSQSRFFCNNARKGSLVCAILAFAGRAQAGGDVTAAKAAVQSWSSLQRDRVEAARTALNDIEQAGGGWSFAKLTIVNAALGALAQAAQKG